MDQFLAVLLQQRHRDIRQEEREKEHVGLAGQGLQFTLKSLAIGFLQIEKKPCKRTRGQNLNQEPVLIFSLNCNL